MTWKYLVYKKTQAIFPQYTTFKCYIQNTTKHENISIYDLKIFSLQDFVKI